MTQDVSQKVVTQRFMVAALVLPLVCVAVGALMIWSWRDQLPDPVATNWGVNGPGQFTSLATVLWLMPLTVAGIALLLALSVVPFLRHGGRGPTVRGLGATSLGLTVFLTVLLVWSIAIQRGLTDAADAPGLGGGLVVGLAAGLVASVVGWFLQPPQQPNPALSYQGAHVDIRPGENVVWLRTVSMARWAVVMVSMVPLVMLGFGLWFTTIEEAAWGGWLLVAVGVLLGLLAVTMRAFRVSVSADGVTVRSVAGWPGTRVPLSEIAEVEVRDVNGMADFGGIGWRVRPDATGVIMRNGEALWITRKSGRAFAVSVDDAAVGAGLVQAFLDQKAGPADALPR